MSTLPLVISLIRFTKQHQFGNRTNTMFVSPHEPPKRKFWMKILLALSIVQHVLLTNSATKSDALACFFVLFTLLVSADMKIT